MARRTSAERLSPITRRPLLAAVAVVGVALFGATAALSPVLAQGWWPWDQSPQPSRPPPTPREDVYRPQPLPGWQPPPVAQPAPGTWGTKNPICYQLEQRLVQEGSRGNQSRDLIPMIESELRQVESSYRKAQSDLDRSCYEYFLFSKTLKRSRGCIDLSRQAEDLRRRLGDLETQRNELTSSAGRSYQDDIVRELARNNCGDGYAQQARRLENRGGPFSNFWEEGETSGGPGGGIGTYGNLGYATYRTLCVRLCDGYYFPVSFSTLPNHFQRDAETCQSKCAAPSELFYYQNPGGAVEQMVGVATNEPYTHLKTAFRYRKEYVHGCSCKEAEFVPQSTPGQRTGDAAPGGATAGGATAGGTTTGDMITGSTTAPAEPGQRAESVGPDGWSAAVEPR
ncbi:MAG: DUF2865 domain-containing protein [Hyphomicrobium sp.]